MASDQGEPLSVLFVEDEPDILTIVSLALALDPAITLTTFDAPSPALQVIEREAPRFDVALLNIKLPVMNGIELMHRLHASAAYADLPVIFITSGVQRLDEQAHLEAGAHGTIGKPFDPLTLATQLRAKIKRG